MTEIFKSEDSGKYEVRKIREAAPSTELARNIFLERVRDLAREKVLDSLSGEPFRLFKAAGLYYEADEERRVKATEGALAERLCWTKYQRPSWRDIELPGRNPLRPPFYGISVDKEAYLAFGRSMISWSRTCNLDEMWVRERAYETLDLWCFSPEAYEMRCWHDKSILVLLLCAVSAASVGVVCYSCE